MHAWSTTWCTVHSCTQPTTCRMSLGKQLAMVMGDGITDLTHFSPVSHISHTNHTFHTHITHLPPLITHSTLLTHTHHTPITPGGSGGTPSGAARWRSPPPTQAARRAASHTPAHAAPRTRHAVLPGT